MYENGIICHRYKFIYFYIPKVACTSFKHLMLDLTETTIAKGGVHVTPFKILANDDDHRDYKRFSFVRNPYDRLASCYVEKVTSGKADLWDTYKFNSKCSFTQFVEILMGLPKHKINPHLKPQALILKQWTGIDWIGRYESLDKDWYIIQKRLGIEPRELPVENPSGKKHYSKYYNKHTRDLVYRYYLEDFKTFKYKKEILCSH